MLSPGPYSYTYSYTPISQLANVRDKVFSQPHTLTRTRKRMIVQALGIGYNVVNSARSTMTTLEELKRRKGEIQRISAKHGISRLRVFGSVARGEPTDQSDLDLLVDMAPSRDLVDLVSFIQEMQTVLHTRVDVVSEDGLSPFLRNKIIAEAKPI